MTGEKNRGTTQEKLWNLDDKTLATPAHDELVLKLLDEKYLRKIIGFFGSKHQIKLGSKPEDIIIKQIESEVPIKNKTGFIVGYWDVVIPIQLLMREDKKIIYFYVEVKPKIDSFGATLRQLNTYREYQTNGNIFIFTPNDKFDDAFISQHICVIHPVKEE